MITIQKMMEAVSAMRKLEQSELRPSIAFVVMKWVDFIEKELEDYNRVSTPIINKYFEEVESGNGETKREIPEDKREALASELGELTKVEIPLPLLPRLRFQDLPEISPGHLRSILFMVEAADNE